MAFSRDKESWLHCTYSAGKARGLPGSFREAAGNQLVDWPTWDHLRPSAPRLCFALQLHNRSRGATRHEHHEREITVRLSICSWRTREPRDLGTSGIQILGILRSLPNVQFRRSTSAIALHSGIHVSESPFDLIAGRIPSVVQFWIFLNFPHWISKIFPLSRISLSKFGFGHDSRRFASLYSHLGQLAPRILNFCSRVCTELGRSKLGECANFLILVKFVRPR